MSEKKEKIPVRVGSQRRVVLPPSVLEEIGAKEGDIVLVSVTKAKVTEAEEENKKLGGEEGGNE